MGRHGGERPLRRYFAPPLGHIAAKNKDAAVAAAARMKADSEAAARAADAQLERDEAAASARPPP